MNLPRWPEMLAVSLVLVVSLSGCTARGQSDRYVLAANSGARGAATESVPDSSGSLHELWDPATPHIVRDWTTAEATESGRPELPEEESESEALGTDIYAQFVDFPTVEGANGVTDRAPAPPREPSIGGAVEEDVRESVRESVREPRLDLTVYSRPIADVTSLIAARAGVNIVLSDEPEIWTKTVTAEIRDQPWRAAFGAILEAHGLRAVPRDDGIIMVVTAARAADERRPHPIQLRYLYARDLLPALSDILATGQDSDQNTVQVYGDPQSSRTLIVYAAPERLARILELVAELDRRPPRVSVEVRMVHVNRTEMEKLGLSYSFGMFADSIGQAFAGVQMQPIGRNGARSINSDHGPALQFIRDLFNDTPVQLNVFLDATTSAGIAETETTPLITANSGVTSEIMVGDAFILPNNQPIIAGGLYGGVVPHGGNLQGFPQSQSSRTGPYPSGYPGGFNSGFGSGYGSIPVGGFARFETGTSLRVTPYVLGEDEVSMTIELIRDGGSLSPDGQAITGGKQSAVTEVTVQNDTPIVIGGLTVSGRTRAESGIPGLSDLPVVGRLFRREEWATQFQDLVIIVTPRINIDDVQALQAAKGWN